MIKPEDIQLIQTLSHSVDTAEPGNLINNLNQHFPGLELKVLINAFENLLAEYTTPPEIKEIKFNRVPTPTLRIRFLSANFEDEVDGLILSRTFQYEQQKLIAKHEYLVLPEKARAQKIGKKILSACLEQYLNVGVKEIHVHAGPKDGGAVWARVGFEALLKISEEFLLVMLFPCMSLIY